MLAKNGGRNDCHALLALSNRPVKTTLAYGLIELAGRSRKSRYHAPWRPLVQRQAFTHPCLMAQRLRPFHAHKAGSDVAFSDVEGGAFSAVHGERAVRAPARFAHPNQPGNALPASLLQGPGASQRLHAEPDIQTVQACVQCAVRWSCAMGSAGSARPASGETLPAQKHPAPSWPG